MLKRTSITLLFTVVVVSLSLFAATEVMAGPPEPWECPDLFPPQSCTIADGLLTISIAPENGEWPILGIAEWPPGSGNTIQTLTWAYNVTGDTSGINWVLEMIPVCCPNEIEILWSEPPIHEYDPGIGGGDNRFNWGKGIYHDYLIKWTLHPSPRDEIQRIYIVTKAAGIDITSMGVKYNNELHFCKPGIAGPDCGIIAEFVPAEVEQTLQLGPHTVCVKRHPTTGCIKCFYECGDPQKECLPWEEAPPEWIEGYLKDCGDLAGMNRHCRECVFYHESSPGCYWCYSNGRYYKKCY